MDETGRRYYQKPGASILSPPGGSNDASRDTVRFAGLLVALCGPGWETSIGFRLPRRASGSRGRGLGPRWFAERLHRDAFVTHLENLQWLGAPGRVKNDLIARPGLHQRAREGRDPADVVAIEIDLVEADDAHDALGSRGIGVAHGCPEEDPRRRPSASGRFRVDHLGGIDPLREKPDATIDFTKPPFAVLIVRVFAAIAVAGCPRDHLRHRRAFPREQKP